jgi:peroxiredoxin
MARGKATVSVFGRLLGAPASILGLLALALAPPAGAAGDPDPYQVLGLVRSPAVKPAPAFTLATPGGPVLRLGDHRGKVVLLNFWATWCVPCREEMPAMERLFRRFSGDGLVVLAVSVDAQGAAAVTPFLDTQRLTYPVGLDPGMTLARRYQVRALPATFLVDRRGRLVASALGSREWDSAEAAALITALLQGK